MNESFIVSPLDFFVFLLFGACVLALGLYKSKGAGADRESFFLAGRGLKWWLIGVSLIAANISSEQFVGMSGQAADYLGMAIASYEWMAAVTLVVVAFVFLPYFLKTGIFTMPHFLEHRYNESARTIMAAFTMVLLIGVSLTGVIYAGALTMSELFLGQPLLGFSLTAWCWIIGMMAAIYVTAGGLRASTWADLVQGIALIAGGLIIAYLAFEKLGATPLEALTPGSAAPRAVADDASGVAKFVALNHDKLNMILPRNDPNIPWFALIIGLWIPNFYYWGLNQYITQRILGSASLKEGQKGIVFAAALKLLIPFIIVIPGIIAFNLYSKELAQAHERTLERQVTRETANPRSVVVFQMAENWSVAHPELGQMVEKHNETVQARGTAEPQVVQLSAGYKYDAALNLLIRDLLSQRHGLLGFFLFALFGAIVSSLAAVLNAASTIFTVDIFQKYIRPGASQKSSVLSGRVCVVVFALAGCILAPNLDRFGSIFRYIQEFQGYASPGILAVFVFGLINRTAPGVTGVVGLLLNPVLYYLIATLAPEVAFLNRMAICFFTVMAVMWVIGLIKPLPQPVVFKTDTRLSLETSHGAKMAGIAVVIVTVILYVIFSPLVLAR
jgi:solute:Na+ symporter, SSS family